MNSKSWANLHTLVKFHFKQDTNYSPVLISHLTPKVGLQDSGRLANPLLAEDLHWFGIHKHLAVLLSTGVECVFAGRESSRFASISRICAEKQMKGCF